MKNTQQSFPFYLTKCKYKFFPFSKINTLSLLLENEGTEIFVTIDFFKSDDLALQVNYRNLHSVKKNLAKEALISRAIDKIIRPILPYIDDQTLSITVNCLKGNDNLFLSSLAALIAIRKLYPIDYGVAVIYENHQQSSFIDSINNLHSSLFICGNEEKILSLEYSSKSSNVENTYEKLLTAIGYCGQVRDMLLTIEPQYEFKKIKKKNIKFKGIDFDYKHPDENCDDESIRQAVSSYIANHKVHNEGLREITIDNKQDSVVFSRGQTVCYSNMNFLKDFESSMNIRYNFYGFSTASNNMPSKRRQIGHENIINSIISKNLSSNNLPINIMCNILSSNGSSSMASVCASSILLSNYNLCEPISGISIGLFKSTTKNQLKVDITALEDKYSEMDCKIASNKNGIVGIFLDTKSYLPTKLLKKTLKLAYENNNFILDKIYATIQNTKTLEKITDAGYLVGPKGKVIKYLNLISNSNMSLHGEYLLYNTSEAPMVRQFLKTYSNDIKAKDNILVPFMASKPLLPHINNIEIDGVATENIHDVNIVYKDKNKIVIKII